jgi:hypothetical protein
MTKLNMTADTTKPAAVPAVEPAKIVEPVKAEPAKTDTDTKPVTPANA